MLNFPSSPRYSCILFSDSCSDMGVKQTMRRGWLAQLFLVSERSSEQMVIKGLKSFSLDLIGTGMGYYHLDFLCMVPDI